MGVKQRLLVFIDAGGSAAQPEPALERGIFLAKEINAGLELFLSEYAHIPEHLFGAPLGWGGLKPGDHLQQAMAWLEQLAEPLSKEGLAVCKDVVWHRHPYEAVLEKVAATRPDIVIKTTRHETLLHRTLFNYTDWHLIRNCPCPLLLAKSEDEWTTRRIVACVDPAYIHSQAETLDNVIIETAQRLAYRLRGELHIFHSIEPSPLLMTWIQEHGWSLKSAERRIHEQHEALLEELLRPYGISTRRVHIATGLADKTLVQFVEAIEASLVVMGTVSKGTLGNLLIGNTAEKVLDALKCDILVVKSNPIEVKAAVPAACAPA
jgi:universal stress protein E